MKRIFLALFAATALVLTGCASTGGSTDGDPKSGSNASDKKTKAAKPEKQADPKFGEAFTWEDGISVTVSKPAKFKPSEYAVAEDAEAYLAFEIVVVNGTEKKFDASLVYVTLQSGDTEAEEIFDSENGFEGSPSTTLLPGRQAKFKVGFGVSDPNDLVMDLTLNDFEHDDVTYTLN